MLAQLALTNPNGGRWVGDGDRPPTPPRNPGSDSNSPNDACSAPGDYSYPGSGYNNDFTPIPPDGFAAATTRDASVSAFASQLIEALSYDGRFTALLSDLSVMVELSLLANAYEQLAPQQPPTELENGLSQFLDILWREYDCEESSWKLAGDALLPFLDQFSGDAAELKQVIGLNRRVLDALAQVDYFGGSVDAKSLERFTKLSVEYASFKPDAESRRDKGVGFFLDTFWNQSGFTSTQKGTDEFQELLNSFESQSDALLFVENVLETAKLVPEVKNDPETFRQFVGLTNTYAKLKPEPSSEESLDFFLSTMLKPGNSLKASDEAKQFLEGIDNFPKFLKFSRNLFEAVSDTSSLHEVRTNTAFLANLAQMAQSYANLSPDNLINTTLQFFENLPFLDTFWKGDVEEGTTQLKNFFESVDSPTTSSIFLNGVFRVAIRVTSATNVLQALNNLAFAYAELNPSELLSESSDSPDFFLNSIWEQSVSASNEASLQIEATIISNIEEELEVFLGDFEGIDNQIRMINYLTKVLIHAKEIPEIHRKLSESSGINDLINSAITYAVFTSAFDRDFADVSSLDAFFSEIWDAQTRVDAAIAVNNLQATIFNTEVESSDLLEDLILGQFRTATVTAPALDSISTFNTPPIPPNLARPIGILIGIIIAARIIDAGSTAPAWQVEINPITGQPYESEEEYQFIQLLEPDEVEFFQQITEEQAEELLRLPRNRGWVNRDLLMLEEEEEHSSDTEDKRGCIIGDVPRVGRDPAEAETWQAQNMVLADDYAKQVTGSDFDFYAMTPDGIGRAFDGRTPGTRIIWEVKSTRMDSNSHYLYSAFNTPPNLEAQRRLDLMTQQRDDQIRIAQRCDFEYRYAVASKGLAALLNDQWSTGIADEENEEVVEYIPHNNRNLLLERLSNT